MLLQKRGDMWKFRSGKRAKMSDWKFRGGKRADLWKFRGGKRADLWKFRGGKRADLWKFRGGKRADLWKFRGGKRSDYGKYSRSLQNAISLIKFKPSIDRSEILSLKNILFQGKECGNYEVGSEVVALDDYLDRVQLDQNDQTKGHNQVLQTQNLLIHV